MQPFLAQRARLILVIAAALACGAGLTVVLHSMEAGPWTECAAFALPLCLVYAFMCMASWWVCRANPLTPSQARRSVLVQIAAAVQSSLVWVGLGVVWSAVLHSLWDIGPRGAVLMRDLTVLFLAGLPLYALAVMVNYLDLAVEASHAAERRVLESQVGAREAELRALRAQIDPHFLFNSLNSINALIGSDPEGARRMCERLGDFMRHTLRLGAKRQVPLRDELALIERYLNIEQVRFGARLQVERTIDPAAQSCLVPPLLLQPLVENAIKHGVAQRVEGGTIAVRVRRDGAMLRVDVENPIDADAPRTTGEGVGLENVRRRLHGTGAGDADLQAFRDATRFRVVLSLPVLDATQETM